MKSGRPLGVFLRVVLLLPLSILFALASELRRFLYLKIKKPTRLNSRVISIGNLTSGGTGKTPFTIEVIRCLLAKGKKIAVVARSYKVKDQHSRRVDLEKGFADDYGDEPYLIAKTFPEVDVYVGSNKLATAQLASREDNYDVILVDDGFQHIKLHRDLEVVLIDTTEARWHYLPLPSGYGRDALWQLDRANVIVLSKYNLATESEKIFAESWTSTHSKVLKMHYNLGGFKTLDGNAVELEESTSAVLVSAIARPKAFELLLTSSTSVVVKSHLAYADHHLYTRADVEQILKEMKSQDASKIITTEKDAVKLSKFSEFKDVVFVALLEPEVPGLKEVVP